jgi:hypothetical protein
MAVNLALAHGDSLDTHGCYHVEPMGQSFSSKEEVLQVNK